MVWVLGLITVSALVWVLAVMMATESDAERRRLSGLQNTPHAGESGTSKLGSRQAA